MFVIIISFSRYAKTLEIGFWGRDWVSLETYLLPQLCVHETDSPVYYGGEEGTM